MTTVATFVLLGAVPLLFGDAKLGWYVISERGDVLHRYADFGGEQAVECALAQDGKTFAFITGDSAKERRVLLWHDGDSKPTPLTDAPGFYTGPSFSPDGEWLYLTHNAS